MNDDATLFRDTVAQLRRGPKMLAVRVSREHYLYLAEQIELLNSEVRATKSAIAHTIGGETDGFPTGSHNYLQRIRKIQQALEESVALQSHYACLLNEYDGGNRLQFANPEEWIARLRAIESDSRRAGPFIGDPQEPADVP